MAAPLVSVLLPVYNGARYLEAAVSSILVQTLSDLELLILDDGSTDDTPVILGRLAVQDSRIHVVSRENRGLVCSLNELASLARAPYLARMDADDISVPHRLETQVLFLDRNPSVVCVGSSYFTIDAEGRYIVTSRALTEDHEIQAALLQGHTTISHPSAVFRRDGFVAAGGYRQDFYPTEDLDLWLRLGELGKLANIDEPLLKYRIHLSSISGQAAGGRQRDAARRCCEAAWHRRDLKDMQFTAAQAWRPGSDEQSHVRFLLRYGWWAYKSGQRRTALAYAAKAVRAQPTSFRAWKLMVRSCDRGLPVNAEYEHREQ